MAGQPKKRAILNYLAAQAQADECTPLEWAEAWVASGKTITDLAAAIRELTGLDVMREQVSRILNALEPGAEARLDSARARGGHAMLEANVDETSSLAVSEDSARVQKQKELNAQRSRIAAVWNRELAEQRGGTQVNISLNTLHLDALVRANSATARIANPPSEQPIEVEVVELPALASSSVAPGDSEVTA